MTPATLNIKIYQGSTFTKPFQWKTGEPAAPVDLTGCTARMQIRKKVTDTTPVISLTTENSRIVLTDAANGKFEIRLTAEDTTSMIMTTGVYDFEIVYPGGEPVYRLFQGDVEVAPEITR